MPTKRAILSELTADELRANVQYYDLAVYDRRIKAELVDALAASRKARLDEILPDLSRDRLKELCRAFGLDDSEREKADIAARLMGHSAQDLHLRPALPEAAVGPVRGGGGETDRGGRARGCRVGRPGRAPVLRAGPGALGRHPDQSHQGRQARHPGPGG